MVTGIRRQSGLRTAKHGGAKSYTSLGLSKGGTLWRSSNFLMTKRQSATKTAPSEEPHIRTLRISDAYSIQFHPSGRRSALLDGRQWLDLDKGTLVWELVSLIVKTQEVHAPSCDAAP